MGDVSFSVPPEGSFGSSQNIAYAPDPAGCVLDRRDIAGSSAQKPGVLKVASGVAELGDAQSPLRLRVVNSGGASNLGALCEQYAQEAGGLMRIFCQLQKDKKYGYEDFLIGLYYTVMCWQAYKLWGVPKEKSFSEWVKLIPDEEVQNVVLSVDKYFIRDNKLIPELEWIKELIGLMDAYQKDMDSCFLTLMAWEGLQPLLVLTEVSGSQKIRYLEERELFLSLVMFCLAEFKSDAYSYFVNRALREVSGWAPLVSVLSYDISGVDKEYDAIAIEVHRLLIHELCSFMVDPQADRVVQRYVQRIFPTQINHKLNERGFKTDIYSHYDGLYNATQDVYWKEAIALLITEQIDPLVFVPNFNESRLLTNYYKALELLALEWAIDGGLVACFQDRPRVGDLVSFIQKARVDEVHLSVLEAVFKLLSGLKNKLNKYATQYSLPGAICRDISQEVDTSIQQLLTYLLRLSEKADAPDFNLNAKWVILFLRYFPSAPAWSSGETWRMFHMLKGNGVKAYAEALVSVMTTKKEALFNNKSSMAVVDAFHAMHPDVRDFAKIIDTYLPLAKRPSGSLEAPYLGKKRRVRFADQITSIDIRVDEPQDAPSYSSWVKRRLCEKVKATASESPLCLSLPVVSPRRRLTKEATGLADTKAPNPSNNSAVVQGLQGSSQEREWDAMPQSIAGSLNLSRFESLTNTQLLYIAYQYKAVCSISLRGCKGIEDRGLELLGRVQRSNAKLVMLDVRDCPYITLEGVKTFRKELGEGRECWVRFTPSAGSVASSLNDRSTSTL